MRRIYLDNAATSFPKPPGVYEAMLDYGQRVGASPGRGHYAESREGARLIAQCRQRLCTLFNGESADHVVFALNTSDALNLAIKGIVRHRLQTRPGEPVRVVTTAMDHNSVLRPLNALEPDGVEWVCVACDAATGRVDPAAVAQAINSETVLVAVNMVSNVTGTIQPVGEIGRVCRDAGVPYMVDGAQALGHVPLDVRAMHIDLLAFPGHKGLLGPQGTGGLYIRPGIESILATTREGGTGSLSEHDTQPLVMPQKYEAGSHNTIGIAGLLKSVEWILERGVDRMRAHEIGLIELTLDLLHAGGARLHGRAGVEGPMTAVRLLGPSGAGDRVGVFSLAHDTMPPAEMAVMLEQQGVLVRSGIHCAPHAHATVGTLEHHGAFRMSIGPFVTEDDVRYALRALAEVCTEIARADSPEPAGKA